MERRPDWSEQLADCMDTAKLVAFEYGRHDCCLFAAYCVDRMTDGSLQKEIAERLNYRSENEARAIIDAAGGLQPLLVQFLGNELESASFAAPGDVALVINEGRELVGIVFGHQVIAAAESGLVALPYSSIRHAWRI